MNALTCTFEFTQANGHVVKNCKKWYSDIKMFGRHFLVFSDRQPKIKRHYTICSSMQPDLKQAILDFSERFLTADLTEDVQFKWSMLNTED